MSELSSGSDEQQLLPLTAAQRGMWFAENMSPDYSVNVAQYLDIRDADRRLNLDLFAAMHDEGARELQSAFTRLVEIDGEPKQVVDYSLPFGLEQIDFRGEDDPVSAAQAWMNADYQRTVDLLGGVPLARAGLLRVADDRVFWYLRGHHLLMDGFAALNNVLRLVDRYNAAIAEQEFTAKPHADLAALVADDAAYISGTRRERDREYWTERAADLPERVTLAQHAATAPLSPENLVAGRRLDDDFQRRLTALADTAGSSLAGLLTAGFSAYLSRMTGTDEVVLSVPVTGRATAKVKRASGMVSNMLPVRVTAASALTFRELIAQIQVELTGVLRHQRYRFEDIRIDAGLRDAATASFGPIVNMVFFDRPIEITGADVEYHILASGILEDLRVNFYQASPAAPVFVDLHGNPHLYTQDELSVHVVRFLEFFERVVDDTERVLGSVELRTDLDRTSIQSAELGEARDYSAFGRHLLDSFEQEVGRHPDAAALTFENETWTYAEFDEVRRKHAARLIRDGVRPGDRVIVSMERGFGQLVAVYAVLTAGAAYVPVDPSHPKERRDLVTNAAGARLVFDAEYFERDDASGLRSADTVPLAPNAPAYVIFTSGSTGTPKGVEVPHDAVINRLAWTDEHYPLTADDVVLYKTPFTFDVSVWELFWPLAVGARTVIARPDGHRDPGYLREVMESEDVTVAHFVPSMLDVYLDDRAGRPVGEELFPRALQRVFTSGEALTGKAADRLLFGAPDVDLVNLYGPTEAAVDVTEHRVRRGETMPPIGSPVPNSRAMVLDDRLTPVPPGAPGELYLAGVQLAHGYVGRSALTSERFVAAVGGDVPGARMYRTGDLVRWNDDGELDYLGRTDFQVKIRGQRVELGEVESVLVEHQAVDAAVAMVRDDLAAVPTLVAYVRATDPRPDEPELLAWSRRRLPSHMVPAAIVVLDDFPINSSGKTDRRALPVPEMHSAEYEAPESEVEVELAGIIAELVGVDQVGRRDNLFELGGNSLVAARLVTRAREGLGMDLRLADVFEATDLAELAAGAAHADHDAHSPLVHVDPRPDTIPLSTAQSRLWLVNQIDPAASTYNMPGAVRLGTDVDVDALRAAVHDVVDRHEILRTTFGTLDDGSQVQIVGGVDAMDHAIDLTPIRTDDARAEVRLIASGGFDLTVDSPFRCRLVLEGDEYILVVVIHHIAADGYSLIPLIADLTTAYGLRAAGEAPARDPQALQYADYALWQHEHLAGEGSDTVAADLAFWRSELAGLPELLPLPTDRPRPAVASGRGAYIDLVADPVLTGSIRDLAKSAGVTVFSVIHAALALVLSRCSGTGDVAVGVAVDGRRDDRLAQLVGMFVDTVVLRTEVSERSSLAELLTNAHRTRARAMGHATVPFERVVEELAPARSAAHTPLFQVGLTMLADTTSALQDDSTGFELVDARVPAAKYDVAVAVIEGADHLDLEISYATDLFDESTAEWLGRAVLRMLDQFTASAPEAPVGGFDVVSRTSLADLTAAPVPAAAPVALGRLWDMHGSGNPGGVRDGRVDLTRAEFDAAANRLARELLARAVAPGDVVAIGTGRSVAAVIAMVAISKAGAVFVSIDPNLPDDRRAEILDDSGAVLGIGAEQLGTIDWLSVDDDRVSARADGPIGDDEVSRAAQADDIAYLIYTSGSTGKPKATVVSHRGLANMAANQQSVLGLDETSRVLQVAAPSFDASIFEITMALCSGAALVVTPPDVFAGEELVEVINKQQVTHTVMTPSVMAGLSPDALPALGTLVSVGEACPPELVERWAGADRAFFNLYGPTESTIWATAAGPIGAGEEVTIGDPVDGVGVLVLGAGLRPVPVGVPGELYLTGDQLALGYLGRPDLTTSRFVAAPFGAPGTRMYRTGDRVMTIPGGGLRYLGRTDFQLKIRGMRVEPGEVDGALTTHRAVGAALTVGMPGPAGDTVLVSYVTPRNEAPVDPAEIRAYAMDLLPGHMVPHTVVPVEKFITNTVGKIDRSALPPVDFDAGHDFVAPRDDAERLVAEVFATELGVDRVSVTESFFEVGGNSLSAVTVTARLSKLRGRRVTLRDMFENPTAADLASFLTTAQMVADAPSLVSRPRADTVPLSEVQRGMWLLNSADPESSAYNIAFALRVCGPLDVGMFKAAVGDLIERQESLRAYYPMVDGEPVSRLTSVTDVLSGLNLDPVDVDGSPIDAVAAVMDRGFDLTAAAPVRIRLLRVSPDEHLIVFVMHHITADGASIRPLADTFLTAAAARAADSSPAWSPLQVQYADFALWQQEWLAVEDAEGTTERDRQLEYWRRRLAGAPELLTLPTDRSRPPTPSFAGAEVGFEIPADLTRRLESLAHTRGTTLFVIVHSAFAALLSRMSGSPDVVIGIPFAGRNEPALADLVGMFVNSLALRTTVNGGEPFNALVDRVRGDDMDDMAHADVAFESVVQAAGVPRTRAYNPVFQAMLWFQNLDFPKVEIAGLEISAVPDVLTSAKVDLQLAVYPNDPAVLGDRAAGASMRAGFVYATDLFSETTIEQYAERFVQILESVAADPDVLVADISIATDADRLANAADTAEPTVPLPVLIESAASATPDGEAFTWDGASVTFASLSATVTGMAAVLPDADSALVTALMSLAPSLAGAGPDGLGDVLQQVRDAALVNSKTSPDVRD
ncbi:amino acid adenylation domain-containing protein [Gordonia zhaorongruii]|uniref:amino acid adenylation domain-containing protein n=1 Tax=Gordonia zhaorongruii TaxID=2597659 RepID=UPI0011801403|nr:non-ribosomal peptide synthetase [Gordonia zhaorongruii]